MTLDPTWEELQHLHRRRLTQQLWKDFSPTKRDMEWYKHNTPTPSPFVTDYHKRQIMLQYQKDLIECYKELRMEDTL